MAITGNAPNVARTELQKRLARIHILIVISSDKAAGLIRSMFLQMGFHEIFIAADAAEAVQLLRDIDIQLIVTDADLKIAEDEVLERKARILQGKPTTLSGIQFVQRLRHAPASPTPFIPILMLMNGAHQEEIQQARDAGVNDIVLKPMEAHDFCQRVIQLIDRPRHFITASSYKGPCRRRVGKPPAGIAERRVREVKIIRCADMKGPCT